MEPFLKAVGGKRWLSTKLAAEIMATSPKLYIEPFVGGGAVTLALPPTLPKTIADANKAFTAVWELMCAGDPNETLVALCDLEKRYPNTAFGYVKARDALNALLALVNTQSDQRARQALAVHTLYINVRCFNGLWRTNADGMFNVPWNKAKSPRRFTLSELKAYKQALAGTEIVTADFRAVLAPLLGRRTLGGTTIYADSPYHEMYDGYTAGGFDEVDQADLAKWLHWTASRGASIFATNSDTELIRDLYSWASIEAITEHHSLGAKADRRGKRGCVLIRNRAAQPRAT